MLYYDNSISNRHLFLAKLDNTRLGALNERSAPSFFSSSIMAKTK